MTDYYAHSKNSQGELHFLKDHLKSTSGIAYEFGNKVNEDFAQQALFCGLMHDLGKYGDLFQRRLKGLESGIDHWSAGSVCSLVKQHKACSLVIEGHHIGLKSLENNHLETLNLENLLSNHPQKRRLSSSSINELFKRLMEDGIKVDFPTKQFDYSTKDVSGMFDIRMLFSTLVDADFIDTENHFTPDLSRYSKKLEPVKALKILKDFIRSTSAKSNSAPLINTIREELLNSCLNASQSGTGVFTLTSPTGSGKTLSLLAFALSHAIQNNLERIILIIPYLSIIDQTSKIYRKIFGEDFDNSYIFEHHSLSVSNEVDDEYQEETQASQSINWDAPIILTTNVQLLQSMFSNKPSSSRKLHHLANSVIMFDEVQTMPPSIIVPSLAALSHLSMKYHSTLVFSTATQPAFTNLNHEIKKHCENGWLPKEIVSNNQSLFEKSKRVEVKWPIPGSTLDRKKLAEIVSETQQILVILNTKRELTNLYHFLKSTDKLCDVFFLSTNLVQEHRQKVLEEIREKLANNQPVKLISTQCIEAGVDVDFPHVIREFAPLDSITQASGRCNRNGNFEKGFLDVILLDNPTYPSKTYRQAIDVSQILLKKYSGNIDIGNPNMHLEYYSMLYDLTKCHEESRELKTAIEILNFEDVAKFFKVIDQDTINILIPYKKDIFDELVEEVKNPETGLTRKWIKKASSQSVSIYRPKNDSPIMSILEKIRVSRTDFSNEWFIASDVLEYNSLLGLVIPKSHESIIIA